MNSSAAPISALQSGASALGDTQVSATAEAARGESPPQSSGNSHPSGKAGRVSTLERSFLRKVLQRVGSPPLSFVLWNGEEVRADGGEPRVRLHVHDRKTLWRIVRDPLFQFCEGYSDGTVEVEGGLVPMLRLASERLRNGVKRPDLERLRRKSEEAPNVEWSRSNVYHHYDISNAFYAKWLDAQLVYTCAYYARPEMTLEEAQVAKLDHVCKKLDLRPGDRVIEAGCGWGALALHMAREYGAVVRAYNLSREQVAYARERAAREHLADRVEFVEADWRTITGECDAFVSVGMLEHVGIGNYRELGEVIHRVLAPHGRGLIHSIGRNFPEPLSTWIRKRIFPGAQPPALSQMMSIFEERNFSVLDVENIRLHYAVTLKHWLERFEAHADDIRRQFDERFVRMWRLYLASSMVAFENGPLQLFQVVFAPGDSNRIPWTRDGIYGEPVEQTPGDTWRQLKMKAD